MRATVRPPPRSDPCLKQARGAAQQAKPVRAWLQHRAPSLTHTGCVLRTHPMCVTRQDADSPAPHPSRHASHARPAQPASPARGLYVIPASAGLHTATAAQAGRAGRAWRRGTPAARQADPCRGGETPPRDPPPPQRPATGAAPSVRGHARRATGHPRPLNPGVSTPGRGRRRPGLARMAARTWGRAAGLRGLAFSLTHRPARVGARRRRAGLAFGRAPPKSWRRASNARPVRAPRSTGAPPRPRRGSAPRPRQGLAPGPNRGRADRRALGQMRLATQAGGGPE